MATRSASFRGLFADDDYRDVCAYFAAHPELSPTPLRTLPALAASLGLGAVSVKDETARFGLNAFKIVGVRYAIHRLMSDPITAPVRRHSLERNLASAAWCARRRGTTGARSRAWRPNSGLPCTVFVAAPAEGDSPVDRRSRAARVGGDAGRRRHGRGGGRIVRRRRAPAAEHGAAHRRAHRLRHVVARLSRRSRASSFPDTRRSSPRPTSSGSARRT